jgi:Integrase core domain
MRDSPLQNARFGYKIVSHRIQHCIRLSLLKTPKASGSVAIYPCPAVVSAASSRSSRRSSHGSLAGFGAARVWSSSRRARSRSRCLSRTRDRPIAARSPWQNGHVERLIASIRREALDHLIVFGESHLCKILKAYAAYYNRVRAHLSLGKDTSSIRAVQRVGRIIPLLVLGRLHRHYVRI